MADILDYAVEISNKCGVSITKEEVLFRYNEPHRYWHTIKHIYEVLNDSKHLYETHKLSLSEYYAFLISGIFHDIVYNTRKDNNEEKSCELLKKYINFDCEDSKEFPSKKDKELCIERCLSLIMGTKTHDGKASLIKKFNELDTKILVSPFIDMLDWEKKIYNEYKWVGWKKYKKGRIKFLMECLGKYPMNASNIKNLIDYINRKQLKIAYYYYEIDKLDNDITSDKYDNLFDDTKIIICRGEDKNSDLKKQIFDFQKRFKKYEVLVFNQNPLKDFLSKKNGNIFIIKDKNIKNYDNTFENLKIKTIYV